jgi:hypothetical protein
VLVLTSSVPLWFRCVSVSERGQMARKHGVLHIQDRMWPVLGFCFVVVFFSLASAAKADTLTFTGTVGSITLNVSDPDATPAYTNENATIDPYKGTRNGNPVILWCVDPDHGVGTTWPVYVSQLGGDLSNTFLFQALGQAGATTTYREMAWLITQLAAASSTTTKQELQAAIWLIAEGVTGEDGDFKVNVSLSNTTFWGDVNADITNAQKPHVLTSGFEILTDTQGLNQEYMVITPEPSTFLLLGAGLIAVILFAQRKRASGPFSGA